MLRPREENADLQWLVPEIYRALLLSSQHCPGRNGLRTPAAFSTLNSAGYGQTIGRVPCGLRTQTNDLMRDRVFLVAEASSLTHGERNSYLNSNLMTICQIAVKTKTLTRPTVITLTASCYLKIALG